MTIAADETLRSSPSTASIDRLCINTIRTLSMDAVQKAESGHPGTPMALAPVIYALWQRFLRYCPQDPLWPNRDRFVLAAAAVFARFRSRVARTFGEKLLSAMRFGFGDHVEGGAKS